MCGLAGFHIRPGDLPVNASAILQKMGDVLVHRGPDDHGTYLDENCGLSFRRLSIIDIEGGHQPMTSLSGNLVIVFNGEIYNYREIREVLEKQGARFRTNSDTEVLLVGFERWGPQILDRIRGMFAFAIFAKDKKELFLARDHTGIKPMYYSPRGNTFLFASEIKAILKYPNVRPELNAEVLPRFLSFLWVPAPETLFRDIYALEPGHFLIVNHDGMRKTHYWQPDLLSHDYSLSEQEWCEHVDAELRRCTKEQMISDVPLGAFLSGGVDSSTIIAYMNQVSDQRQTTFTTGFRADDLEDDVILSDIEHARVAAQELNVDYNELILKPDVVDLLPKLVWHMDEPVTDPAAITTYLICKASRDKAKVMLSGVGGDEIFGGYPRYLANLIAERYALIPQVLRKFLLESWVNRVPVGSSRFFRNSRKFVRSAHLDFEQRYFGYLSYYSESELQRMLLKDHTWSQIFALHRGFFEEYRGEDGLQTMMNVDLRTFLPYLNLMYTDKMSSAASIEVRVPFLDHLLIEKIARIPGNLKIKNGRRKYIFKKVAEKFLSKEIVWRKKAGFGAPIGAWLRGQVKDMMLDLLSEERLKRRGYFDSSFIHALIRDHLSGESYNANQLWQLMTFELWHQEFIG